MCKKTVIKMMVKLATGLTPEDNVLDLLKMMSSKNPTDEIFSKIVLVSISTAHYEQLFHTKVFFEAFLNYS